MVLVDTSVWVNDLRGDGSRQVRVLHELLAGEDIVGTAPIIVQEILQGADSDERFEKWRGFFTELWCYRVHDPLDTHVTAARLYQICRRTGRTPRSSNDCLIAQIAIENQLSLLHSDRDFDAIAKAIPQLKLYPLP